MDELSNRGSRSARARAPKAAAADAAPASSSERQRLQYLLSVNPAIIYTTKAAGDFGCTFVNENLRAIMGYSPQEMTTDPKCWPDHLHPDDSRRVFEEMRTPDRTWRRHRRVSLPPSRWPLHLGPVTIVLGSSRTRR